jgi:hypothetical protein
VRECVRACVCVYLCLLVLVRVSVKAGGRTNPPPAVHSKQSVAAANKHDIRLVHSLGHAVGHGRRYTELGDPASLCREPAWRVGMLFRARVACAIVQHVRSVLTA